MAVTTTVTVVGAIREFFGRKPDQTLQEFMNELKELSTEDKEELGTLAAQALGKTIKA